jgi:1-acyl-sn-glycerol-3-phosphate acyltransferase
MSLIRTFVSWFIRFWSSIICRIEHKSLTTVPKHGPLILAINHIGSLEVPLFAALLQPRKTIALAKIETWNNKPLGWLFDLWGAIPIHRGEVDLEAIRRCLIILKSESMLVVAPEGTRSYNGRLQRGQPGISFITLRSGSPILPIVHWGGENFGANLKRFKRTEFHIRVGKAFTLDAKGQKVTREIRQEMADQIMYQLAVLMPEQYRGEYKDCNPPPTKYLRFA